MVHHAEAAGAEDVVATCTRSSPHEGQRRSSRTGRRTRITEGHAAFIDRRPPVEQATVLEELAGAAYVVDRLDEALPSDRAGDRDSIDDLGDAAAIGRCTRVMSRLHWYIGDGAARTSEGRSKTVAILESLGESIELARAYSGFSQLAMLAQDIAQAIGVGRQGAGAGDASSATRRHTYARARQHRHRQDSARSSDITDAARSAHHRRRRRRAVTRRRVPSTTSAFTLMYWAQARGGDATTSSNRSPTPRSTRCTTSPRTCVTVIAWLRLRAGEWDEAERVTQDRDREGHHRRPTCWPRRS